MCLKTIYRLNDSQTAVAIAPFPKKKIKKKSDAMEAIQHKLYYIETINFFSLHLSLI